MQCARHYLVAGVVEKTNIDPASKNLESEQGRQISNQKSKY